jgi:hypothetical protein
MQSFQFTADQGREHQASVRADAEHRRLVRQLRAKREPGTTRRRFTHVLGRIAGSLHSKEARRDPVSDREPLELSRLTVSRMMPDDERSPAA